MLCQERGQILRLLPGIPRAWLEDGQRIALSGVATYFGPVTLEVVSHVEQGFIEAKVTCDPGRKPERVELRLPHPLGRRAASVEGGRYEAGRETVIIEEFRGEGRIVVRF